ncbi:MAG: hypothetical protein EBR13_01615 [Rhodobacteraceae bacterium]|nr:hypothetical protein [Paracoccaceae bacterium]
MPHLEQLFLIFENNLARLTKGSLSQQAMILRAIVRIAVLSVLNIKHLIWNRGRLSALHRGFSCGFFRLKRS